MTNQDYEAKKRECWEEYTDMIHRNLAARYVFDKIFDRAFALGKQEKDAADVVISGWVGRDMSGSLYVYHHEPERNLMKCLWEGDIVGISLSDDMFPDLTWDDAPEPVEIIIKRKKNG